MRGATRLARRLLVGGVVGALLAVATSPASAGAPEPRARPSGSITVSAAASLHEAFTTIGEKFERANRGTDVTFNFGSSSTLVTQIRGGAPVDVFASADLATMDELVTAGSVTASPTVFARNGLVIAVKRGNPKGVTTLADLARVGTVSLCGATVPCGVYAADVLSRAGVTIPGGRVTRGIDAKATLGAVSLGDADAALVYVTDVLAAGNAVDGVTIPDSRNAVAVYTIAPIAASDNRRLAKAFIAYVVSPAGQKILARYGFRAP